MCGLCYVRPLEQTAALLGFKDVAVASVERWLVHLKLDQDEQRELWEVYLQARQARAVAEVDTIWI